MVRNVSGSWARQYNLTDHLGSVRAVVENGGTVLQQTDYYPFGTAFAVSNTTKNKYLYGSKELQDEVIGGEQLSLYNFEARFMDTRIPRFTGIDQLTEKFYNVSPYMYCANNPIIYVDLDGREYGILTLESPIYDREGNFLGTDDQGFSGDILIFDNPNDFKQGIKHEEAKEKGQKFNTNTRISQRAKDKIITHILDGTILNNGYKLKPSDYIASVVHDPSANARYHGLDDGGKHKVTYSLGDYEWTVENIRSVTVYEIWGHGIKKWLDENKTHHMCYYAEIDSKYWRSTTDRYKKHAIRWMLIYLNKEKEKPILAPKYYKEWEKYK